MKEALEPTIDLGEGVRLIPATDEHLAQVEANLRPGDKMEHDFCGGSLKRPPHMPCWVVLDGEDVIGAGGFILPRDATFMSSVRIAWFLSTTAVNTRKKKFVRYSPRVIAAMVKTLPSWVDTITVCPMNIYPMSIKWLKKTIKMRFLEEKEYEGGLFTILCSGRKEIQNV